MELGARRRRKETQQGGRSEEDDAASGTDSSLPHARRTTTTVAAVEDENTRISASARVTPPPPPSTKTRSSGGALSAEEEEHHDGAGVDGSKHGFVWRRRWTVVSLCFVAFALCNMDRVNMSITILPMREAFGWDVKTVGIIQSSFFWGYLLTQVAGGVWSDRFGGKRVLGFGVAWWSMATALTPIAAKAGLPALLIVRACMGIGEGVAMPAMNTMLSRWVPTVERSRSLAVVYSGMYLGSVLGLAGTPHLTESLGWPSAFYIFGVIGLGWVGAWVAGAASTPQEDVYISDEERAYIEESAASGSSAIAIPWRFLLTRTEVWAIILCHFCHNWSTFILLTWSPTYYSEVLGLDLRSSGVVSVLPWICMGVMANVGGWIADTAIAEGYSVTFVRKVMQTIGFLGPAVFLTQLGDAESWPVAVGLMCCSQGLDAFSQSGLYSNHADIAPRYAGVLLGLSNTAGVLAGVASTWATGHILHDSGGDWNPVWESVIFFQLTGVLLWNTMASGKKIEIL